MGKRVTEGTTDIMAMTPDQASPVPRPKSGSMTVYRDAYATEVIDFMGKGFSLTAFAGEIGQPFEVICDWMRDCPAFALAVAKGRAKRVRNLEETFLTTNSGPKVTSHKHALNNAAPHEWRDRTEVTGADGGPIQIAVSLEEARRRASIDVAFEPVPAVPAPAPGDKPALPAPSPDTAAPSVADALKAGRKPK